MLWSSDCLGLICAFSNNEFPDRLILLLRFFSNLVKKLFAQLKLLLTKHSDIAFGFCRSRSKGLRWKTNSCQKFLQGQRIGFGACIIIVVLLQVSALLGKRGHLDVHCCQNICEFLLSQDWVRGLRVWSASWKEEKLVILFRFSQFRRLFYDFSTDVIKTNECSTPGASG